MKRTLLLLGRHQAASIASTVVDFSVMTAMVEVGWLHPATATFVGAACGGVTNFLLGRRVFGVGEADGPVHGQAFRYALVSGASAALNALGVYVIVRFAALQYIVARAVVAIAVSILWNFPMQRHFVFRSFKGFGIQKRDIVP